MQLNTDELRDIGKVFSSPAGKRALKLLNKEFYNTISFVPGDPTQTAFNEGHRDVIQFLNNVAKATKEGN